MYAWLTGWLAGWMSGWLADCLLIRLSICLSFTLSPLASLLSLSQTSSRGETTRSINQVKFYDPYGRYLRNIRIPGDSIAGLTWEGSGKWENEWVSGSEWVGGNESGGGYVVCMAAIALYFTVLWCTLVYYTVLYYTVLYYTTHTILNYIHYTVMRCNVICCNVTINAVTRFDLLFSKIPCRPLSTHLFCGTFRRAASWHANIIFRHVLSLFICTLLICTLFYFLIPPTLIPLLFLFSPQRSAYRSCSWLEHIFRQHPSLLHVGIFDEQRCDVSRQWRGEKQVNHNCYLILTWVNDRIWQDTMWHDIILYYIMLHCLQAKSPTNPLPTSYYTYTTTSCLPSVVKGVPQ